MTDIDLDVETEVPVPERMLIGDRLCGAHSGRTFAAINPATEEPLGNVPGGDADDVDDAVHAAHSAMQGPWREMAPEQRGALINRLGDLIDERRVQIARLETLDMGKPLGESYTNVARAVRTCRYYAGACDKIQGDSIPVGRHAVNFTLLEPLGVTAHITPWNYPFANAMRSLPPALAAGSTAVMKPASVTSLTTLLLGELCLEAGFPPGVVNVVTGTGSQAGAALARHPLVRGITFTGSVETGQRVMSMAAEHIRPCVLELGGKNPQIVFADADLDHAVAQTLRGAYTNGGQVCTSISRLLVEGRIYEEYVDRIKVALERMSIGPGLADPDLGPLVSAEHRAEVESFAQIAGREGARLVTGGERPSELLRGYYYRPTLFDRVEPSMRIAQEEVFGSILAAIPFKNDAHALAIANGLELGLTAGVFTSDLGRAMRFVRDVEAGMVWVNDWFASPVQVPHGGYKESGLGREQGLMALQNYLQIKNVSVRV